MQIYLPGWFRFTPALNNSVSHVLPDTHWKVGIGVGLVALGIVLLCLVYCWKNMQHVSQLFLLPFIKHIMTLVVCLNILWTYPCSLPPNCSAQYPGLHINGQFTASWFISSSVPGRNYCCLTRQKVIFNYYLIITTRLILTWFRFLFICSGMSDTLQQVSTIQILDFPYSDSLFRLFVGVPHSHTKKTSPI